MSSNEDAAGDRLEWDSRRLHKYSIEDLQETIGKALYDLTGKPYDVEIRTLDRYPRDEVQSGISDIIDMSLRVREDPGEAPF